MEHVHAHGSCPSRGIIYPIAVVQTRMRGPGPCTVLMSGSSCMVCFLQGLHSVRSENLDAGTQPNGGMRRSRTAPRPLPQIEEPLLAPDVRGPLLCIGLSELEPALGPLRRCFGRPACVRAPWRWIAHGHIVRAHASDCAISATVATHVV